jgi:LuxR family maltose regulon positive regulatory protein
MPVGSVSVPLTGRENDVLSRLPYYASRAEIAHDVGISLNTVKTHLRNIYGKLGVRSRAEAVDKARDLALLG